MMDIRCGIVRLVDCVHFLGESRQTTHVTPILDTKGGASMLLNMLDDLEQRFLSSQRIMLREDTAASQKLMER